MEVFRNRDGEYGKYIMQELTLPPEQATPEAISAYESLGKKYVYWMDDFNMPGSNQLITAWYFEPNRDKQLAPGEEIPCHVHNSGEILCYYGSDPADPYDLHAEIEFVIGDERHVITKSSLIFVPAGVPHSKPLVNSIDRPVFHFAMMLGRE